MKGLDRDFGIIQVKAEMKLWKWMSSLKEKLDSKKHERAVTEHGEIFTITPEHGGKKPDRKQKV